MSLDLGHSKGYIQGISSGRALPSMAEFLSICEYFNITPCDFFDAEEDGAQLVRMRMLEDETKSLSCDDFNLLIAFAKRMNSDK